MPFKSKAQRRACYARNDPNWDCGEWESHTKNKRLPERVTKDHMDFKSFYHQAEVQDISEGKVGRFLGRLAGVALPTLGGAYATASMMGTGDPLGPGSAPGGLAGFFGGMMKGGDIGAAIGDSLGDKLWSGVKSFLGLFRRRKPAATATQNYIDKLAAGRTDLPTDEPVVRDQPQSIRSLAQRKQDDLSDEDYMTRRQQRKAASEALIAAMSIARYSSDQIMRMYNLSPSNEILTLWAMNYMDAIAKAGQEGGKEAAVREALHSLADMIAKGKMEKPQRKERAATPAEEPQTVKAPDVPLAGPEDLKVPDSLTKPSVTRQIDLFGNEIETPSQKRRRSGGGGRRRRAPTTMEQPGLFDN